MDRTEERAALERLLDGARRGSSGVLVLRGAPGIGKSALLDHAASLASDFLVSRVTGVESEIALGYAGVHQLVAPFLDHVAELPDPQRHVLESVLGLAAHDPPDSLLVFLAVLSLIDVASRETPMLLVVDDAQWLDERVGADLGVRGPAPARRADRELWRCGSPLPAPLIPFAASRRCRVDGLCRTRTPG